MVQLKTYDNVAPLLEFGYILFVAVRHAACFVLIVLYVGAIKLARWTMRVSCCNRSTIDIAAACYRRQRELSTVSAAAFLVYTHVSHTVFLLTLSFFKFSEFHVWRNTSHKTVFVGFACDCALVACTQLCTRFDIQP